MLILTRFSIFSNKFVVNFHQIFCILDRELTLHFVIFSFVITIFFFSLLNHLRNIHTVEKRHQATVHCSIFLDIVFFLAANSVLTLTWKFWVFHNFHQVVIIIITIFSLGFCSLSLWTWDLVNLDSNYFEWFWSTNGPHLNLFYFCHIWAATVCLFLHSFELSTIFNRIAKKSFDLFPSLFSKKLNNSIFFFSLYWITYLIYRFSNIYLFVLYVIFF